MHKVIRCAAALILVVFTGCVSPTPPSTPEDFISVYDFNPFRPPRDADGVGTVISFDERGHESIIYRASSCLKPADIPAKSANVAIPTHQYKLSAKNALEWKLGQDMGFNIDPSGILEDNAIVSVKFRLTNPTVISIEKSATQRLIESLEKNSCLHGLLKPDNLIIHSVLSAGGVEYSFHDEHGNIVDVRAKLKDESGAHVKRRVTVSEDKGLVLEREMFFGYRAWRARDLSSFLRTALDLQELTVAEVEALRND